MDLHGVDSIGWTLFGSGHPSSRDPKGAGLIWMALLKIQKSIGFYWTGGESISISCPRHGALQRRRKHLVVAAEPRRGTAQHRRGAAAGHHVVPEPPPSGRYSSLDLLIARPRVVLLSSPTSESPSPGHRSFLDPTVRQRGPSYVRQAVPSSDFLRLAVCVILFGSSD